MTRPGQPGGGYGSGTNDASQQQWRTMPSQQRQPMNSISKPTGLGEGWRWSPGLYEAHKPGLMHDCKEDASQQGWPQPRVVLKPSHREDMALDALTQLTSESTEVEVEWKWTLGMLVGLCEADEPEQMPDWWVDELQLGQSLPQVALGTGHWVHGDFMLDLVLGWSWS